jgi:hypothetical protein
MRITKAAIVATGAIAILAAMGSAPALAAAAAPNAASAAWSYHTQPGSDGMAQANAALHQKLAPGWVAPWQVKPAPLLSVLDGSSLTVLPVQVCGSTAVVGAGAALPINSPNTVLGDCNNGNTALLHH